MRASAVVVAVVAAVHLLTSPAATEPGSVQDPDDTEFMTDIRAAYHDDSDDETVTYYVQMWDSFPDAGWVVDVVWDFDEDGETDGSVQGALEYGPSALVYGGPDRSQVDEATIARAPVGEPHEATGSDESNTLRIDVTRAAMENAGMGDGDDGYNYFVLIGDPASSDEADGDETTDGRPETRHDFSQGGAPATLRPGDPAPATAESSGVSTQLIAGAALLVVGIGGGVTYAMIRRRS